MSTGVLFVMNFWKGRRKDKDSPTPPTSDDKQYLEENCLKERVIDADFVKLVQLPPNLDSNEWLATHTISFFNHVNLMYGVVTEYCTSESCATMVGPDNVQYHWQDEKGKKVKQSAPQYIDHMMSYVQKSVTDESLFPTKFGQQFPPGFPDTVRKIQRYLFHVLAHIYHSHYGLMVTLGMHGHLNTLFCHFMAFSINFQLLQDKEAEVLMDLHRALLKAMQDSASRSSQQPADTDQDPSHTTHSSDPDQNQQSSLQVTVGNGGSAIENQGVEIGNQGGAVGNLGADERLEGDSTSSAALSQTKHSSGSEKNGVPSQHAGLEATCKDSLDSSSASVVAASGKTEMNIPST